MPVIQNHQALDPEWLSEPNRGWRRMIRIETTGGDVGEVIKATNDYLPERLLYAEGDSWFDKLRPLPLSGTNLLDAIRTPFLSAVVDVSHIGEEVRDMVRGHQARQTQAMFKLFGFQAILLSAGGNDLKNLFADLFSTQGRGPAGLSRPASHDEFFAEVIRHIGRFIELRDGARDALTRQAPIFVHGYDYLQPRPAEAAVFAGSRIGRGPWLYPAMQAAGLSDAEMRSAAAEVIDELNRRLVALVAPLANVFLIDQRGLLTPAAPGSTGPEGDWMDEIHPSRTGFTKLARHRWDVPLAQALGWQAPPGALRPAMH